MVYFCSGLWFTHAARKAFEAGIVIENGWIVEVQECWQNIVETQLANTYGTFFGPEKEKTLESIQEAHPKLIPGSIIPPS